ncbi:hypothetical protein GCM10012279_10110 [Micromonospora yangpuensis]|nr:hypothetical protein GCM10012279_10110 [Micromonospora yangpuensis]
MRVQNDDKEIVEALLADRHLGRLFPVNERSRNTRTGEEHFLPPGCENRRFYDQVLVPRRGGELPAPGPATATAGQPAPSPMPAGQASWDPTRSVAGAAARPLPGTTQPAASAQPRVSATAWANTSERCSKLRNRP